MFLFALLTLCASVVSANTLYWDGRVPQTMTETDLDSSLGPYLTVVKGSENASHYTHLLGDGGVSHSSPTPLWNSSISEQVISVTIDNSSIFVPGSGGPQNGFRRTDLIAQGNGSNAALDAIMEVGVSKFYFSIKQDVEHPLNYSHEYQIVFIEPSDGSHIFEVQLGSAFSNPTGTVPAADAHLFKVRDCNLNILFETPFTPDTWHNFAVQINWDIPSLQIFYSVDGAELAVVTPAIQDPTMLTGAARQGDFHIGVLKLPLVNPNDSSADQNDVVHYGIQEGSKEGLLYSGAFVERVA